MVATRVSLGSQRWLLCLLWYVKDTQRAVMLQVLSEDHLFAVLAMATEIG